MAKQPLVSVVIPLFNGRRFLREALESCAAQSHAALEVVVVDDGSTDDGPRLARETGARVLSQRNAGVAVARNRGLEEARGEYVVFLDQDDRLAPRAVEAGLAALGGAGGACWVVGLMRRVDAGGRPRGAIDRRGGALTFTNMLRGQARCGGPPARALFPRALLRAVGGFDPRHAPADDYDLFLKLARRAEGRWHDEVVVDYRRHEGNVSNEVARTLRATLGVLRAHASGGDAEVLAAWAQGRAHWRGVFGPRLTPELLASLRRGHLRRAALVGWTKVVCALATTSAEHELARTATEAVTEPAGPTVPL